MTLKTRKSCQYWGCCPTAAQPSDRCLHAPAQSLGAHHQEQRTPACERGDEIQHGTQSTGGAVPPDVDSPDGDAEHDKGFCHGAGGATPSQRAASPGPRTVSRGKHPELPLKASFRQGHAAPLGILPLHRRC